MRDFPIRIVLLTIMLLSSISCEITEDAPAERDSISLDNKEAQCEIDLDAFINIFDQDVTGEIDCLKLSLYQFAKFVETKEPGYIHKDELLRFIKKFFDTDSEKTENVLDLFFIVYKMVFESEALALNVRDIPTIIDLLKVVNKRGKELKTFLLSVEGDEYWGSREKIKEILNKFGNELALQLSKKGSSFSYNIKKLFEMTEVAFGPFKLGDKVEPFLKLKRFLVGGSKVEISGDEIVSLIQKFPKIYLIGTDIIHLDKFFDRPLYLSAGNAFVMLNEATSLLNKHEDDQVLLEHVDILEIGAVLLKKKLDIYSIQETIVTVKSKLIGGDAQIYLAKDLRVLFEKLQDVIGAIYFFGHTYEYFSDELNQEAALPELEMPSLEAYKVLPVESWREYWDEFIHIASEYLFFSDGTGKVIYSREYRRDLRGVNRTYMLRFLTQHILNIYGKGTKENGKVTFLTSEEAKQALVTNKGLLVEMGVWPRDINRMVSEFSTGADLFQPHANGDSLLQLDELVEYLNVVISAGQISKLVKENFSEFCPLVHDWAIEVDCFRDSFTDVFFSESNLWFHFPFLSEFIQGNTENQKKFFRNVEEYSRWVPKDEIPLDSEDMTRLLVSLSNMESIFRRYDNGDNILVYKEIMAAFRTFKKTIEGFLKPKEKKFAKSVFFYFIKHGKRPTSVQLIFFHLFAIKKKITASRLNVSNVLLTLSKE